MASPRSPPDEAALRAAASHVLARLREMAGTEPWTPPAMLLWWGAVRGCAIRDAPGRTSFRGRRPWTSRRMARPSPTRCSRAACASTATTVRAVADLVRSLPSDVVVEQAGTRYAIGVRPIYPDEVDAVACP